MAGLEDGKCEDIHQHEQQQQQQQHSIRILQVRIYDLNGKITAKVLHQLVSPFGYVEKIVMFPDLVSYVGHLPALIQFRSHESAVSTLDSLQGRWGCMHDNCCHLDMEFVKEDFTKPWLSSETPFQSYDFIDSTQPVEYDTENLYSALIAVIDTTMKQHADNVKNELKSVKRRLLQLENSVEDLKESLLSDGSDSSSSFSASDSVNVVPNDDVVDKVTSMEFLKNQVMSTVKMLAETKKGSCFLVIISYLLLCLLTYPVICLLF